MTGPRSQAEWRLAEALALEAVHGADVPRFIAERLGGLAVTGDQAGVERMLAIAAEMEKLMTAKRT